MSRVWRHIARFLVLMAFVGWITYPGWYHDWYFDWGNQYSFPASMSNDHDPRWGFWWY
jgi:hypothetical protein